MNRGAGERGTALGKVFLCSPDSMGLLDPATSDGRVIFFLPWEG